MTSSEITLANGTVVNGGGQLVAVGKLVNSLPAPDFAGLTIESQTNAIGLIHPPPDIRAIVDKTAQFVAKNGADAIFIQDCECLLCTPARKRSTYRTLIDYGAFSARASL